MAEKKESFTVKVTSQFFISFVFLTIVLVLGQSARSQTSFLGEEFKPMPAAAALENFRQFAHEIPSSDIKGAATQQNGRLKPLDTMAREIVLFINGRYTRWGLDSVQMYLAFILSGTGPWVEFIEMRNPEIRTQLGFLKTQRYASVAELEATNINARTEPLIQKQQDNAQSLTTEQKDWLELLGQLSALRGVISGEHLIMAMDFSRLFENNKGSTEEKTRTEIATYLQSLKANPHAASQKARALVEYSRSQKTPELFQHSLAKMDLEVLFNETQIFLWAASLYLLLGAALLYPELRNRMNRKIVSLLFIAPLALQIGGLAVRVYITRFAPITNMYGTMIWVALGINVFSFVLFALYGNRVISGLMLMASGIILFLAQSFPLILSPDLDPIVAVLRNNFWLSTHVTTITISYAAFSIAMLLGNITLVRALLGQDLSKFVPEFEKHAYRAVQLGCFLLTVGIILGGIWADYSWGRFWGWDPKETWALIADLSFIALLHARYAGWARGFIFLALTPVAYLMVLMAWYGVNFILAAGLHSYGFSSGGAMAVSIFVAIQLVILAAALTKVVSKPA